MEIVDNILESADMGKKDFFKKAGIETDEAVGVQLPLNTGK